MKRLLVILVLLPVLVFGAEYTNDFSSATGADSVLITSGVTLSTSATCGTLTMTGGTLTLTGYLTCSNDFRNTGGKFNPTGGTLEVVNGVYSNLNRVSTIYTNATLVMSGSGTIAVTGTGGALHWGTLSCATAGNTTRWSVQTESFVHVILNGGTLAGGGYFQIGMDNSVATTGITGRLSGAGIIANTMARVYLFVVAGETNSVLSSMGNGSITFNGSGGNPFAMFAYGSIANQGVFLATNTVTVAPMNLNVNGTSTVIISNCAFKTAGFTDGSAAGSRPSVIVKDGATLTVSSFSFATSVTNNLTVTNATIFSTGAAAFNSLGTNIFDTATVVVSNSSVTASVTGKGTNYWTNSTLKMRGTTAGTITASGANFDAIASETTGTGTNYLATAISCNSLVNSNRLSFNGFTVAAQNITSTGYLVLSSSTVTIGNLTSTGTASAGTSSIYLSGTANLTNYNNLVANGSATQSTNCTINALSSADYANSLNLNGNTATVTTSGYFGGCLQNGTIKTGIIEAETGDALSGSVNY